MKKILCIIIAFILLFGLASCGKKIVVNKKPHVEAADRVYDESEIAAGEETYMYCGTEYELIDMVNLLSINYEPDMTYDIVCKEIHKDMANQLGICLKEMEINYTINGEKPEENTSDDSIPDIITE